MEQEPCVAAGAARWGHGGVAGAECHGAVQDLARWLTVAFVSPMLGAGAVDACGRPLSALPSLLPLLGLGWGYCSGGKLGKKCQGRQGHDSSMPSNTAVKQWALGNSACRIVAWDSIWGLHFAAHARKPVIWQKSAQLAAIVRKEPGAEWAQG